MFKVRKVIFFLILIGTVDCPAQELNMREVFQQMPDSIVPYLSENNRLDFIDFVDSKMDAVVTNLLGGKSTMNKLTNKYVSLSLSAVSSMEMRLLPLKEPVDSAKQIICLVLTYGKDFRESDVRFYSLKWRKLLTSDYLVCPHNFDNKIVEASLCEDRETLTLRGVNYFDRPANEEQNVVDNSLITFNWKYRFVNE